MALKYQSFCSLKYYEDDVLPCLLPLNSESMLKRNEMK